MSENFSRRSIRYSLSVLVTSKRLSDGLLYKRSEQHLGEDGVDARHLAVAPRDALVRLRQRAPAGELISQNVFIN